MEIKNGQGWHRIALEKENTEKVRQYFQKNPTNIKAQACRDLRITLVTLNKHLRIIKELEGNSQNFLDKYTVE